MSPHGAPCWYDLAASDLKASAAFYGDVLGWTVVSAGMDGFDYFLAMSGEEMVAGLMVPDEPMPEFWTVYFAVDDCDRTVAAMTADGASVHRPPEDIPGTGRFAILTDPQGAVFGLLQPLDGDAGTAFDPKSTGHGAWHELSTSDPKAAIAFYSRHLGWSISHSMDMGEGGSYDIIRWGETDIGGMMRLGAKDGGGPAWLPYFGTDGITAAAARFTAGGGKVRHGPAEVPGGALIIQGTDPAGAPVALVGPK